MDWRDHREYQDGDLPEAMRRGFVRRGRRFTPPGQPYSRARSRRPRRSSSTTSVQIGEVVAELTPRQAVVWLMNLDTMMSLYESTTEQQLDQVARANLVQALRGIIRQEHGPRS